MYRTSLSSTSMEVSIVCPKNKHQKWWSGSIFEVKNHWFLSAPEPTNQPTNHNNNNNNTYQTFLQFPSNSCILINKLRSMFSIIFSVSTNSSKSMPRICGDIFFKAAWLDSKPASVSQASNLSGAPKPMTWFQAVQAAFSDPILAMVNMNFQGSERISWGTCKSFLSLMRNEKNNKYTCDFIPIWLVGWLNIGILILEYIT